MSKSIKLLAILGVVASVAACGNRSQEEEFVVVEPAPAPMPAPITHEPVFTGKYK